MAVKWRVYITGVGFSPSTSSDAPSKRAIASAVSAATKALLDAGLTYDDVTRAVSSVDRKAFTVFDHGGVDIETTGNDRILERAISRAKDKGAQCVLAISWENFAAFAFIVVSESFLWRHPYLIDSAAAICECEGRHTSAGGRAETKLYDVCAMVWTLRGWSCHNKTSASEDRFYYRGLACDFELGRADGKHVPKWKAVEHKQDGRHRLGYNPAAETRAVFWEDFETVKSSRKSADELSDWADFDRRGGDRAALAKL